jgi:small-conductance mechanosensitive channel
MAIIDWLRVNWLDIAIPVFVFLGVFFVSLWLRRVAYGALERWLKERKSEIAQIVIPITKGPFLHWLLILGAYIALRVSVLEPQWQALGGRILASIFIAYLGWILIRLSREFIKFYLNKTKASQRVITVTTTVTQVTIIVVGILILLELWWAPVTPILIVMIAAIVVAILAFRDTFPELASSFQLTQQKQIKTGDLIRLESGEEGHVEEITWRNTQIRTLDGNIIIIPNTKLMQTTIINYGKQPKVATEPFQFSTRLHLKELTGLSASNLSELVGRLNEVPDAVVYYHTHSFVEEYQFLTPEPTNDFALWVQDALGYDILAERLASIDTFEFSTIGALRQRIIGVIQDFLAQPLIKSGASEREAPPGDEFHFIKSISIVLPTPYVAHNLREFVSMLRRVSIGSLFFHIFEARLRLQRGTNDFSLWLEECLGEKELAEQITRLDPYNYTMENLREIITQLCEKKL